MIIVELRPHAFLHSSGQQRSQILSPLAFPSKTTPYRQVIFFKSLANSKVEGLGVMSVAISSPKKKRNEVNQSIGY